MAHKFHDRAMKYKQEAKDIVQALLANSACRKLFEKDILDLNRAIQSGRVADNGWYNIREALRKIQYRFESNSPFITPDPQGTTSSSGRTLDKAKQFVKSMIYDLMHNKSWAYYLSSDDELALGRLNEKIIKDKSGERRMSDNEWREAEALITGCKRKIDSGGKAASHFPLPKHEGKHI